MKNEIHTSCKSSFVRLSALGAWVCWNPLQQSFDAIERLLVLKKTLETLNKYMHIHINVHIRTPKHYIKNMYNIATHIQDLIK